MPRTLQWTAGFGAPQQNTILSEFRIGHAQFYVILQNVEPRIVGPENNPEEIPQ